MRKANKPAQPPARPSRKQAWIKPELARARAADAEGGANPISPEGAFAIGS